MGVSNQAEVGGRTEAPRGVIPRKCDVAERHATITIEVIAIEGLVHGDTIAVIDQPHEGRRNVHTLGPCAAPAVGAVIADVGAIHEAAEVKDLPGGPAACSEGAEPSALQVEIAGPSGLRFFSNDVDGPAERRPSVKDGTGSLEDVDAFYVVQLGIEAIAFKAHAVHQLDVALIEAPDRIVFVNSVLPYGGHAADVA